MPDNESPVMGHDDDPTPKVTPDQARRAADMARGGGVMRRRIRELERQANVAIANGLHMTARRLLRQADSLRKKAPDAR